MRTKFFELFYLIFIAVLCSNCTSVENYNKKIEKSISVENLKKDVDFVQRKLVKLHPDLYSYISKEQLNFKFDSLRNSIRNPMTTKDFYFAISPIVASVHQGHMSMSPVLKRFSKKELKRFIKSGNGPLSQFSYEWENEKLYVIKNKSKNKKIKLGTEVLSVNGITPQFIHDKYKNGITSDGLNKTFLPKYFSKRYIGYVTNEIGVNDSLTFNFKQKDSIFTTIIGRNKPEKTTTKTSTEKPKKIILSDKEKAQLKKLKRKKKIFGYDDANKAYSKSLRFISNDSLVAVLKIENFSKGWYDEAYEKLFDSIKKQKAHTLILDIRDNPGGRVSEVVKLYSYFTDKDYVMVKPALVTSKTSLWKTGVFNQIPLISYPLAVIAYPFYMAFSTIRTKKVSKGIYKYGLVGTKERKFNENHFTGKIYVVINGGSFSAACLLSSALKANPYITFVGEETGGGFNGTVAGIMPVLQLPHSKIPWRLGLMEIESTNTTSVFGHGIYPDKEIIQTIEDKINKKDPEIDWILNEVKN